MKKLGLVLLFFFSFMMILYAIMQSPFGKSWIQSVLTSSLKDVGVEVQIGSIEGVLPNQILLKDVKAHKEGLDVQIETVQLRPILWRLLKKEIAFREIKALHIQIDDRAPFDFQGKARVNQKRLFVKGGIDAWNFSGRYFFQKEELDLQVQREDLKAKAQVQFLPSLRSNIQIQSPFFKADVEMDQKEEQFIAKAHWELQNLGWIGPLQGDIDAIYQDQTLQGSLSSLPFGIDFEVKILPHFLLEGTSSLKVQSLSALGIPNAYGTLQLQADWSGNGQTQEVVFQGLFEDLFYDRLFSETLRFSGKAENIFQEPLAFVDFNAHTLSYRDFQLEAVSSSFTLKKGSVDYSLSLTGTRENPLDLFSEGSMQKSTIHLQSFRGSFQNQPFQLVFPTQILYTENTLLIPQTEMRVGEGSMQIMVEKSLEKSKAHLLLQKVPTSLLHQNPLLFGEVNLQADLFEKKGALQGFLKGTLAGPLTSGSFDANLHQDDLDIHIDLTQENQPFFQLDGSLPISFSLWPFEVGFKTHSKMQLEGGFQGRMEQILDSLDLKYHHLQGNLKGSFSLSNTLSNPNAEGSFVLSDGSYDNFYSGTDLQNIQAEAVLKKQTLFLRSFAAQDRQGTGSLQATGEMKLLLSEKLPFHISMEMQNLQVAEIDLVNVAVDGSVQLSGNTSSATAKGKVIVKKCTLSIPDHIPNPLPDLEVVYRHSEHQHLPPSPQHSFYPLKLDLQLKAPENIVISGRGLESRWTGDFKIQGDYNSIATKGNLDLVEGTFRFSSRSFKLNEGSLIFSGVEHQLPLLHLAAETEIKGILIMARLKGPLDNPQLTLLSNPPLPPASVISYLLFGQDISEIGALEALQIATSLASISGTGPDVMESTRKSLGIDRLRVITEPDSEGGETVSLQVGKYVAKGVLVSLTQGTEESSTNISVEIEIKGHFILQIESDQRQEQGKFTLKWSLSY